MKNLLTILLIVTIANFSHAQVSARLMRFPDVSETHITFMYGDDVWIVPKSGGTASRLSSADGSEAFPKFSPDGKYIAYTANYEGNDDIYLIESFGGVPSRLTYHGFPDRIIDWAPDGKSILFASSRESGRQRYNQFHTISITGGPSKKLPVPYGEFAAFSPDGTKIAFTDRSRLFRTWKRYRGGTAPDIHIFDINTFKTERITTSDANDEMPMWHENTIYFLSDRGQELRLNLWKYDISSKKFTQLTHFTDFDINFPSIGPKDIVFQAADKLFLLDLATEKYTEVPISVISDQQALLPKRKIVSSYIQDAHISPDGKRVVVQARGELFSLPAEEGFVTDITQTSGSAERSPSWSPNGKYIAYWSDASGEYQLTLYDVEGNTPPQTLTSFKNGFRYRIFWSPDSKKMAYVDQAMNMQYYDMDKKTVVTFDKGMSLFEGGLKNFAVSWSPDSKWIAYSKDMENQTNAIYVYDTEKLKSHQITSGFYFDGNPCFSPDGKYLFYTTNRSFNPVYSDVDNTFIYPNTTTIAALPLAKDTESLFKVKNDEVDIKKESDEKDVEKEDKGKEKNDKKKKKEKEDKPQKVEPTVIDFDGIEKRVELLPVGNGNIGRLSATNGKVIYTQFPNSGAPSEQKPILKYYDIEKKESKSIIENIQDYILAAKGEKILIRQNGKLAVIEVGENKKIDKVVPTSEMVMNIEPLKEWKQIFNDAWRLERDYFYDPNMHGVDWEKMKTQYGALIDQASSRSDVNYILGELIGELNASHTYRGGGDSEHAPRVGVGCLGADFILENGKYKVTKIIEGATWDAEVRSPLQAPGIKVKEGDYILAINGIEIDPNKPIHAYLQGLANKPVELTINDKPSMKGASKVLVKPLSSEDRLRHLAWIENNRKRVEDATDGKIGYIYVRSTGIDGQNELIRQYFGQLDKEGLIIDERFNSGGQIPDRFIEILDRKPLAFWAVRDGKDWSWPPAGNFGPKVMMINGFSGSGGDAFPDFFRKSGLGPLIGTRTWGGLIGISGVPSLIDDGGITVPTFRMYDPDGKWFKEGHGVDPDIEVFENFEMLANGKDAQLEAAITEIMKKLNSENIFKKPKRPSYEKR